MLLQQAINALTLGSLYALIAIGGALRIRSGWSAVRSRAIPRSPTRNIEASIGTQSPRPSPTANTTPRYAPHMTSDPWAKFTTSRMENVMASPMAMSAYRLPSVSALIACWRSTAPMVPNLSRSGNRRGRLLTSKQLESREAQLFEVKV